jgi:hypothetical protein
VHGMAHVSALDVRSRVLRGNIPSHHLLSCGCVGSTRMSVPLRGEVYVTSDPMYVTSGPVWNLTHSDPCAC